MSGEGDYEDLVKKHPILYKQRNGDMRYTSLCWGFQCGPGWYKIIAELSKDLDTVLGYDKWYSKLWYLRVVPRVNSIVAFINTKLRSLPTWAQKKDMFGHRPWIFLCYLNEGFQVSDVKEKYGTLRFYMDYSNKAVVDKLIYYAETQSETTCEECGEHGELSGFSWLNVLCEKHRNEKGIKTHTESVKEYEMFESNTGSE